MDEEASRARIRGLDPATGRAGSLSADGKLGLKPPSRLAERPEAAVSNKGSEKPPIGGELRCAYCS